MMNPCIELSIQILETTEDYCLRQKAGEALRKQITDMQNEIDLLRLKPAYVLPAKDPNNHNDWWRYPGTSPIWCGTGGGTLMANNTSGFAMGEGTKLPEAVITVSGDVNASTYCVETK